MLVVFEIIRFTSALAFLSYGVSCLFSEKMKSEFERYGLVRFRTLTGSLEVIGGLGLLAGFFFVPLTLISSGGLSLLMLLGLAVRIRIRDKLVQMVPAFLLLILNFFIFVTAI